tara:strand:- start:20515 stop:20820 length:306 start_codon:yes stop_codon:yes gene_type:complete
MIKLNLDVQPNQSLKYQNDQELYEIVIRTTSKSTFYSVFRNQVEIISNQILIANTLLIQSKYQQTNGNFIFYSISNEFPDYNKFNVNQFLYYATNKELANG